MFYTYVWLREDGTPYYVGKGSGIRAYKKHKRHGCAPPLGRIVFYIAKDESEAFENEIALIWYYGRKLLGTGCLRNMTDGGENPPSAKGKKRIISEETKHKMSLAKKGRTHKSRPHSEESKRKMSIAHTGHITSEEAKRKLSLAGKGRIFSEESKHKIRLAHIGLVASEETKLKMSLQRKGKPQLHPRKSMSIEKQRASHRESCARYTAKKKQEKLCQHPVYCRELVAQLKTMPTS